MSQNRTLVKKKNLVFNGCIHLSFVRDNDAAMIEKMATDVSNELIINAPSSDFDVLVGMGADMEKTQPFLHLKSDDVRMGFGVRLESVTSQNHVTTRRMSRFII